MIRVNDEYIASSHIMRVSLHPADLYTMCIILSNGNEIRQKISKSESPLDALAEFARKVNEASK